MDTMKLQKLEGQASEMALHNTWSKEAYKMNKEILNIDPKNCAACTRLAKYYKINDNITQAKNMYLKALTIDPSNRGAINNLNDIEKDQKESDEVDKIKTTKELLKEGKHAMVKGKYRLAEKLFSKTYSIEPLLAHAISLAEVYKKMGKYDKIEKLHKELMEDQSIQKDIETIDGKFKGLFSDQK